MLLMSDPEAAPPDVQGGLEGRQLTYSSGASVDVNQDDVEIMYSVRDERARLACVSPGLTTSVGCTFTLLLLPGAWFLVLGERQACFIHDLFPDVRVVVDVFEMTSMKFLTQRYFEWKMPLELWPPFAGGLVYCNAILDSMLCSVRCLRCLRSFARFARVL